MTDLNELLKQTSRSLYLSARLLPPTVRASFAIAYLLCRYADTIADTSLLAPEKRLHWIQKFPSLITHPNLKDEQQILSDISGASPNIYEEKLLHQLSACRNIFNQLSNEHQAMILEVVHAVCHGMEIDLQTFPAENSRQVKAFSCAADLENYCHLMGGDPGVFWSKLIASHVELPIEKEAFFALGKDIGDAEQIVNILRDLPRDLRIGRCYFPADELAAQGLSAEDLLVQVNSPKFEPIKQKWIDWGRQKLRSAQAFYAALPKTQIKHRTAVAWPVLWAADTLNKISAELNLLDNTRRVKIPRSRIYATMLVTPPIWASNTVFNTWLNRKFKK